MRCISDEDFRGIFKTPKLNPPQERVIELEKEIELMQLQINEDKETISVLIQNNADSLGAWKLLGEINLWLQNPYAEENSRLIPINLIDRIKSALEKAQS